MPVSVENNTALILLENMPFGAMVLENNSICWVNSALAELLFTSKDSLIGLTAENARNTRFAPLFASTERISVTDVEGAIYWIRRDFVEIEESATRAQLFSEISDIVELEEECDQLAEKLGELEVRDEITGLLNRKSILQAVDTQVSRSRRYENPLSLIRLTLESKRSGDEISTTLQEISHLLKDQLRWADQIGLLDQNTFLIILPETSLADAKELASKLANDRTTLGEQTSGWSTRFGAAAWQKGDDPGKLLSRLQVDQELNSVALLS